MEMGERRFLTGADAAKLEIRRKRIVKKFAELYLLKQDLAKIATEKTKYSFYASTISNCLSKGVTPTKRVEALYDIAEEMIQEEEDKIASLAISD